MEKKTTAAAAAAAACCGGDGDGDGDGDARDPFLLLSEDFFIHILVRLPVVSLLRFKSVCKSWRALIQTSYFIHLHTTTTTTTTTTTSSSKFGTFILQALGYQHGNYSMENAILMLSSESGSRSSASGPEYGGGDWYWGTDGSWHKFTGGGSGGDWHWVSDHEEPDDDYQDEVFKADDDQLVLKLQNFGLPSCYMLCSGEIIAGSCNGLICLHDSYRRAVSLWNPATRQFRRLPKSITTTTTTTIEKIGNFDLKDFVGFGFDVKTKDYKVLLITYFTPRFGNLEFLCRVQVYSLSTDSWRRLFEGGINLLPSGLPMAGHHGLYLNGSYFFVGTKITSELLPSNKRLIPSNNRLMFSFDFTKEIFNTMQLPDHDYRQNLVLSCLGKKLALFTTTDSSLGLVEPGGGDRSNNKSSSYEDYDIWVWNEHGGACSSSSSSSSNSVNKESWTKLHSFRIKNKRGGGLERSIPRGISNNGEFALIEFASIETRCYSGLMKKKKKMQLFNLITKEAKKDFLICDSVCRTDVYQQSLVSMHPPAAAAADRVIF